MSEDLKFYPAMETFLKERRHLSKEQSLKEFKEYFFLSESDAKSLMQEWTKSDEAAENYLLYRGKCKLFSERLVAEDPTLRLVRGFYHCPMWGKQDHWWCEKPDGTVVDPTVKQFPTAGAGAVYEEFNGICECAQCGKKVPENEAIIDGRYAFCRTECNMRFVGL